MKKKLELHFYGSLHTHNEALSKTFLLIPGELSTQPNEGNLWADSSHSLCPSEIVPVYVVR